MRSKSVDDPDTAVIEAKVMTDAFTGRSRCFGYVTFRDVEGVDKAVENRDHNIIENKWVV